MAPLLRCRVTTPPEETARASSSLAADGTPTLAVVRYLWRIEGRIVYAFFKALIASGRGGGASRSQRRGVAAGATVVGHMRKGGMER